MSMYNIKWSFLIYYFSKYELGSLDEKTPYVLSANGDKKYSFKSKFKGSIFLKSGFTFAFSSIAAAGLVAVALIPTFMILKSCSATSGAASRTFWVSPPTA